MIEVENLLIELNNIKESWNSIDIYFNDVDKTFVVKLIDNLDEKNTIHFREMRLLYSLLDCHKHLILKNHEKEIK